MATDLRIVSLTVATNQTAQTFNFTAPITFISGTTSMGKSTLLMLLKHALGGNAALTPAVVEHVTHVDLEVKAGVRSLVLRRRIGADAAAVEVLEPGSSIVLQTWPVSPRPADAPSISRFLLECLGIPVERFPTTKAGINARSTTVTFNDVFRYSYMQAKEIDRSVAGHLDAYSNRSAAFELMFGLIDPELLDLKRRRGIERETAVQLEKDAAAIERFIVDDGVPDRDTLRARRLDLREQLRAVEEHLRATREEVDALTAAEQERRTALSAAMANAARLREDVEVIRISVRGREASLAQLRLDLAKAERLGTAVGLLGSFEFSTCPRCMQDVSSRTVGAHECILCCQPIELADLLDESANDENAARVQTQISETEALLNSDIERLTAGEHSVTAADEVLYNLSRAYDDATSQVVSPRIDAVAALSKQAEAIRQHIRELDRNGSMWQRLDRLRAQVTQHRKSERQLAVDIKNREKLLPSRGALLDEISSAFEAEVDRIGIPTDGTPRIDAASYLPFVGATAFEDLQASGGGASTALNIAYHLTLLIHALDHPNVLLPNLLIIDSPRKAIGNSESDRALGRAIYTRLTTLADIYGSKVQFIVADNDVPPDIVKRSPMIVLTSERSTVPGVTNTGVGRGQKVEDL